MYEVLRVKEAQRQEFMRRFYGKSQDEQFVEMQRLLQYSMNSVDKPSVYRGPSSVAATVTLNGEPISSPTRAELRDEVERARLLVPGDGAGTLPVGNLTIDQEALAVPSDDEAADTAPADEATGTSEPAAPSAEDATPAEDGDAAPGSDDDVTEEE
jgi:hypothetical protein